MKRLVIKLLGYLITVLMIATPTVGVASDQDNIEEAIESIERAVPLIRKKRERARPLFVLAQLKQRYGRNQQAIDLFEQVVKLRTPYEMEFQARMQQALAYDRRGGRSEEIPVSYTHLRAHET